MKFRHYYFVIQIIKIIIAVLLAILMLVLVHKIEQLEANVSEPVVTVQKVPTSVNFVICVDADDITSVADADIVKTDTQEQIYEEEKLGDIELVAQMVQAEAGNQDLKGKRLVADVIYNRVSSEWAESVEGVIFQRLNGVPQFSSLDDGNFTKAGWNMSEESFIAARLEYNPQYRLDSDILYFSAGRYNNSGTPAYKYQDHYFSYK